MLAIWNSFENTAPDKQQNISVAHIQSLDWQFPTSLREKEKLTKSIFIRQYCWPQGDAYRL